MGKGGKGKEEQYSLAGHGCILIYTMPIVIMCSK